MKEIKYLNIYNSVHHYTIEEMVQLDQEGAADYVDNVVKAGRLRTRCIQRFGFAIPDEMALSAILDLGRPIVEIGAGSGYWAHLLKQRGGDVVAIDNDPNKWGRKWFPVIEGDHTLLPLYSNRVLFSCWPLNYLSLAEEAYKGETMIYIGEECCDYWNRDLWRIENEVNLPQWDGCHDYMTILQRVIIR